MKKGDLFEVPRGNIILAHACNCKGRWGSGIAARFHTKFPDAYADYRKFCERNGKRALGTALQYWGLAKENRRYGICSLFTSNDYGSRRDSVEKILENTDKAIEFLLCTLPPGVEIHSPKINAGLFGVPWQKTQKIIKKWLRVYKDVKWTVWEL